VGAQEVSLLPSSVRVIACHRNTCTFLGVKNDRFSE